VDERSDEHLVAASREGDKSAYAELVRRHVRRVYAVCLGILGSVVESEDMAQEALVKGLTSIHTLQDGNQFGSWIGQIPRNLCLDWIRLGTRRRELLARHVAEAVPSGDDHLRLHEALSQLPEKYRLPLMLFYFDGKSSRKLARELNLSQAGACTRLSRARRELRKLLAKQAGT